MNTEISICNTVEFKGKRANLLLTIKEEGLLAYAKGITSLKTKKHLLMIAATFGFIAS